MVACFRLCQAFRLRVASQGDQIDGAGYLCPVLRFAFIARCFLSSGNNFLPVRHSLRRWSAGQSETKADTLEVAGAAVLAPLLFDQLILNTGGETGSIGKV